MHMHVLGRGLATSEHLAIFFVENGWRRRERWRRHREWKWKWQEGTLLSEWTWCLPAGLGNTQRVNAALGSPALNEPSAWSRQAPTRIFQSFILLRWLSADNIVFYAYNDLWQRCGWGDHQRAVGWGNLDQSWAAWEVHTLGVGVLFGSQFSKSSA